MFLIYTEWPTRVLLLLLKIEFWLNEQCCAIFWSHSCSVEKKILIPNGLGIMQKIKLKIANFREVQYQRNYKIYEKGLN